MKKYNIAVIGATGIVGYNLLTILAERNFPVGKIFAVASQKSGGRKVSFGEAKELKVMEIAELNFADIDIVFNCTDNTIIAKFIDQALAAGCIIIDKSSLYRLDRSVPLIVPEINLASLKNSPKPQLIASPNCCVIPIAMTLKTLDNATKINRVVITTFQSVSGAGRAGMDELFEQTKAKFMNSEKQASVFEQQIAFNLIPQIGDADQNGDSDEEQKITSELQKILGDHIKITATCVRVPVFIGHSMTLNIEFAGAMNAQEAAELLTEADGIITLTDRDTNYVTPIDIVGEDHVFVSRIRNDNSLGNSINLWLTSDNLRKGAALNAVQIAEELISK